MLASTGQQLSSLVIKVGPLIQLQKISLQNSEARIPRDGKSAGFLFPGQKRHFAAIFLILITRFWINCFQVLFFPSIQNKEPKESDQQYTFLISIELLIDDKNISTSSDNNKHAISSRRGIEVACKGGNGFLMLIKYCNLNMLNTLLLHMRFCLHQKSHGHQIFYQLKKYCLVNKIFAR